MTKKTVFSRLSFLWRLDWITIIITLITALLVVFNAGGTNSVLSLISSIISIVSIVIGLIYLAQLFRLRDLSNRFYTSFMLQIAVLICTILIPVSTMLGLPILALIMTFGALIMELLTQYFVYDGFEDVRQKNDYNHPAGKMHRAFWIRFIGSIIGQVVGMLLSQLGPIYLLGPIITFVAAAYSLNMVGQLLKVIQASEGSAQ